MRHLKNVLRSKVGDEIEICDESANRYKTVISDISNDEILFKILEKLDYSTELNVQITLFQGLPKSDKMDLIVQKCTELGVTNIVPIITERVIVKIDDSNENKKIQRWQKIANEAGKQSGRQKIPKLENIMNLENVIENLSKYDIVIMPYENEKNITLKSVLSGKNNKIKNIAVVIGPEGGFSEKDIEAINTLNNLEMVSLGKRILRTETAGIATISMITYEFEL